MFERKQDLHFPARGRLPKWSAKPLCCVAFGVLSFFVFGVVAEAEIPSEIEIVTEEFPPRNYTENGVLTGESTDIVNAVLKEIGIRGNFSILPWARAMQIAQRNQNTLIYSIARKAERESLFKWVGTISSGKNYIYCLASRE